jgi:hypothetical protein
MKTHDEKSELNLWLEKFKTEIIYFTLFYWSMMQSKSCNYIATKCNFKTVYSWCPIQPGKDHGFGRGAKTNQNTKT